MLSPTQDKLMQVKTLAATEKPQSLIWLAMHQCYCSEPTELPEASASEESLGESVVHHLLAGNRGHYSPLEQAYLSLSCSYLPHTLVQQLTRHRHLSFSVQSFRYTGKQFINYSYANDEPNREALDKLFYLGKRPTEETYYRAHASAKVYTLLVENEGLSQEEARGLALLADYRQHAVVGGNLRAWWHLLDLRLKPDTQAEFQQMCLLVQQQLQQWVPQLQNWYDSRRATKAVLSP